MSRFVTLAEAPAPVIDAPAPWQLRGQGYILAIRLPAAERDNASFLPDDLRASRRGALAYVMFVDYAHSPAGPYHELLFIPGSLQFTDGRHLSISRIYVSSWESVVNGRANWGIPKDRCDFQVRYGSDGVDDIRLSLDGQVFAELKFQHRFFRLPFHGGWVPERLRTLGQRFRGREFTYAPTARGHIKPARLLSSRIDGALFPSLANGRVVACVKVTDFEMAFPVAGVRELEGETGLG